VASARRGRHIRGGLHPLHDLRPRSRRPGPPVTGSSGGRSCEHGRRTTWPQHQPHLELDQGIRAAQRMARGTLRRHRRPSRHRHEPVVGPAVKGGRSTRPTLCRSQPRGADHTAAGPGASQFPGPLPYVGNLQNLHQLGDVRSQHAVAAETTSQPGGPAFRVAEADRLRGRTPSTCAFAVRIRKGAVRSRQGPAGGVCLWSRCKTSTGDLPDGAAGAQAETPTARAVGKVSRRIVGHERRRYNYSALLCV
jgi:hypothetical protein